MKIIKYLISTILCMLVVFSGIGCKNKEEKTDSIVGIAIFQNSTTNNYWSSIHSKPDSINNYIKTENDEIAENDKIKFLFFCYSKNEITQNTKTEDLISNTTFTFKIENQIPTFAMERIATKTDILIYFVYKTSKNEYYLKYKQKEINIDDENVTYEVIEENNNTKFNLTVSTNLTTKKEY